MDMPDHRATLLNERINPHFGRAARAIESSESRKIAPLINWPAAAPNPRTNRSSNGRKNMRPRASEFWPLAQVHPTNATNRALEPGAPNRALYSHHQRFKFASSQPRVSVDTVDDQTSGDLRSCIHALHSFGSSVGRLQDQGRFTRLVMSLWTLRSARREGPP
jgi:hypothetical protein